MLTSIARASARRMLSQRLSIQAPQLIVHAPSSGVAIRFFTASRARLAATAKATKSTTTKTTSATKKPAAKKTAASTKKPAAKKPATKKPATKKKTKTAAKPKPKRVVARKKKVLTPEEKQKLEVREAKKASLLDEPARLPVHPWLVFTSKNLKKGSNDMTDQVKELAPRFRSLSSSELEDLRSECEANKRTNRSTYKAWVEMHPVEEVYLANAARRKLARLTGKKKHPIEDERQPKRPAGAYATFIKARFAQLKPSSAVEAMRSLGAEWKQLNEAERRSYTGVNAADSLKYQEELVTLKEKAKSLQQAKKEAAKATKAQAQAEI